MTPSAVGSAPSFVAMRRATLRATLPTSRSSWRTPLSRVYWLTSDAIASSVKVTGLSPSPFSSSCRGIRYFFAISAFSRSV